MISTRTIELAEVVDKYIDPELIGRLTASQDGKYPCRIIVDGPEMVMVYELTGAFRFRKDDDGKDQS